MITVTSCGFDTSSLITVLEFGSWSSTLVELGLFATAVTRRLLSLTVLNINMLQTVMTPNGIPKHTEIIKKA